MSLEIQLETVADELRKIGRYYEKICKEGRPECSEDDFRSKFEDILYNILNKLGVPKPVNEYKVKIPVGDLFVKPGRIDSYYGLVFFEYKLPHRGDIKRALDQVKEYINGLLNDGNTKRLLDKIREEGLKPLIVGVITNGQKVVFVEYDVDNNTHNIRSLELDKEAVRYMIRYIIASWKRRLDAHTLSAEFGHGSDVTKRAVSLLYNKLVNASGKTLDFFEEWKRQVSIVYPSAGVEIAKLAREYGVEGREIDGSKLFFAIQTYYSLILKLLAAEVASRFYDSVITSFLEELRSAGSEKAFRERLERLEAGGPMAWYGVLNLLEGQLFSWYLDVWDGDVYNIVKEIVNKLSEFDTESLEQNPALARDLFKVLYEELVPRKEVRRALGIYTTPDWLAELVLDELGLTVDRMLEMGREDPLMPLRVKVLDPGVGTGTFLVLYLQRIGEYLRRRFNGAIPYEKAAEILRLVTQNVVGFDVDVLALLTARVNYLIALASIGLLQHKGGKPIEIPVYMANSIAPAEYLKDQVIVGDGVVPAVKIQTAIAEFTIPAAAMGRLKEILEILTDSLNKELDQERVANIVSKWLGKNEVELLKQFYKKLLELKRSGRDTVWLHVVKSYLIPNVYLGQFDFVVGNPPWLTFNELTASYQQIVKGLIKDRYELTTKSELITQMEMATLFFVRSIDLYLKDRGKIGFVMPYAVFNADQHHNFRKGEVKGVRFAVVKVIDAEGVSPLFYVPACAVIAEKGARTRYPVPAIVLKGKLQEGRYKTLPLREAMKHLSKEDRQLYIIEIGNRSAWAYKQLQITGGRSYYYEFFKQGATIVPRPFFFVEIVDIRDDFVVVRPSKRVERREAKAKFDLLQMPVEKRFIYGVLTSSEVLPFCHLVPNIAALPIEPSGFAYVLLTAEELRKRGYPYMAQRMEKIEKEWESYRGEKKERMTIYDWLNYQNKLTSQNPSAKYRVVYNTSGTHLVASVVETGGYEIEGGKVLLRDTIIDYTLYVYHTNNKDEANYLVAVLNSSVLDKLVKPFQSKGAIGERHVVKKPLELPIPKYDPSRHSDLAELGEKAREKACGELEYTLKKLGIYNVVKNRGYLTPNDVGRLREAVRESLKPILAKIDERVRQILTTGRNSLFDYMG